MRVAIDIRTTHHKQQAQERPTYLPVCDRWWSSNITIFLINALAGGPAETLAKEIKVGLLRRLVQSLGQVETNVTAIEAVLLARRRSIGCTRTRNVFGP